MTMQLGFVEAKLGFCDGKTRLVGRMFFLFALSLCVLGILGTRKLMNKQQPLSLSLSLF